MRTALKLALAAAIVMTAAPASAGNKLIAAGKRVTVAKSTLSVSPGVEWNKLGARPGRNSESWTLDGDELNDLTFYGGIQQGRALFRDVDKKNRPLPKVSGSMLITDIPALLENSYRIALGTADFAIEKMEPVEFAGANGVRFTYLFSRQNESLHRRGEARGAIVDGKLYMITYEAPVLHYYDRSVQAARAIADSARIN
jgi:hypothetical protein